MSVNLTEQDKSKTSSVEVKTLGERAVSMNHDDNGGMSKKIGDERVQNESNKEDRTGSYPNDSRTCQVSDPISEEDKEEASPVEFRGPIRGDPLIKGSDRGVYTGARAWHRRLQGGRDTDSEVGPGTIGMNSIIVGRTQSTDQIDRGRQVGDFLSESRHPR